MQQVTVEELKRRMGVQSVRAVFRRLARYTHQRIVDEIAADAPIAAQRDGGRWVALCECGGAEVVAGPDAPGDEQVFFCCSCGNASVGGRWRPVVYEEVRDAVE